MKMTLDLEALEARIFVEYVTQRIVDIYELDERPTRVDFVLQKMSRAVARRLGREEARCQRTGEELPRAM